MNVPSPRSAVQVITPLPPGEWSGGGSQPGTADRPPALTQCRWLEALVPAALAAILVATAAWPAAGQELSPRLTGLLGKLPADSADTRDELLALDAADMRALCGLLAEPEAGTDEQARHALHGLALAVGDPGRESERSVFVETIVQALSATPPPPDEAFLLSQLRLASGGQSAPELARRLSNAAGCREAVVALLGVGGDIAAAALRQALPESTGQCQIAIINALGVLGDADSLPAMLELAESPDQAVRLAALYALARGGQPRSGEILRKAVDGESWYQRSRATDFLLVYAARLAASGHQDDAAALYHDLYHTRTSPSDTHVRCAAVYGLAVSFRRAAVPDLLAALTDENPQARAAAANAAVSLPGQKSTRDMLAGFYRASPPLQSALLEVMARRGDRLALSPAVRALELPDAEVRAAAARTVAALGSGRVALRLVPLLDDADEQVVSAAHEALVKMPGQLTTEWLAGGLPEVPARQRAILLEVLAERPPTTNLEAIITAATDTDAGVRLAALRTLAALAGEPELPALLKLLVGAAGDDERAAAGAAVSAVCQRFQNHALAVAHVVQALREPDASVETRCELLGVLGRLGDEHARKTLLNALADGEPRIKAAAARALSEQPEE